MVLAYNSLEPWFIGTGECHVAVVEAELQLEVEDLARTKWMTGTGLPSCNPQSWIEWLADDVVLSLRLGPSIRARSASVKAIVVCFGSPGKSSPDAC